MKLLIAAALWLGAAPATAVTVETVVGDWADLPQLTYRGTDHLAVTTIVGVHDAAITGECKLPGQQGRDLDLNLPFAAQFAPDGTLSRILLPKLNCPKAEGLIGGALIEMIKNGDYKPTGENDYGWYQGRLSFSSTM